MSTTQVQPTVLVLGAPGSGKGTLAKSLAHRLGGATHITSGGVLRRKADMGEMPDDDRATMESGGLVTSDTFQSALASLISEAPLDQVLILDGMAKKPAEAPWLLEHLISIRRPIEYAIFLRVSEPIGRARIQADENRDDGRADDDPAAQDKRWKCFREETLLSIRFFQNHIEDFLTINADSAYKDEILAEATAFLARLKFA